MKKGVLLVVSAPAGCGKDTIIEKILERDENVFYSVSATTRAMRPGETDGVSYFFKSVTEFEQMIENNELLEYTKYCNNYYGTPKKAVLDMLAQGKDVVLKIEVEGAENVRKIFPEAVLMFILPPSISELERRLHKRGTEDEETIQKRLKTARTELELSKNYDYAVINDELEIAIDNFLTVLKAERLKVLRNTEIIESIKK